MPDKNDFFSSRIFSARARTYWIYKEIQAYDLANRATVSVKLNSYSNAKCFFFAFLHAHFSFEVMSVYSIDRYQNSTPRAMPLHELKKVQIQEHFMLLTHDSIGHLKMLCMSVYC